jgi:hypothetical protein
MPIYDVVAWFDRPVGDRRRLSTRDDRQERVDAEAPEAAARKWLWRLSDAERRFTVRVVVFAPKPRPVIPLYQGPPVRFGRRGGSLVELGPDGAQPDGGTFDPHGGDGS